MRELKKIPSEAQRLKHLPVCILSASIDQEVRVLLPAKEDPDEPLLCGESLCVKGGNNPVGALKYF